MLYIWYNYGYEYGLLICFLEGDVYSTFMEEASSFKRFVIACKSSEPGKKCCA